jgi:hypothetical protein
VHQQLWQHDPATATDAVLLRARMRDRSESVCVITVDDTPVPDWLADAPRCDFAREGVRGATDFALRAIEACGGSLRTARRDPVAPAPLPQWGKVSVPFLSQLRAHSALRHQLDAIVAQLGPEIERGRAERPGPAFEMCVVPNRVIACLGEVGLSFSWMGGGQTPTVGEGRLLVIQWADVASQTRGVAALRSARAVRERVYRPDAADAENWRWRVDDSNGQAYTTTNLVAEWLARSSMPPSA